MLPGGVSRGLSQKVCYLRLLLTSVLVVLRYTVQDKIFRSDSTGSNKLGSQAYLSQVLDTDSHLEMLSTTDAWCPRARETELQSIYILI